MYANSNVHNSLHYDKINANVNKNTLKAWCDKREKPVFFKYCCYGYNHDYSTGFQILLKGCGTH